jgi:adenosylmethionine-8-amino-7-oxononanoate aminotransferase
VQVNNALWSAMLPPTRRGRDDRCAISAYGVRVRFADGRERLCGTSGLWNVNLGYGNAVIAQAVGEALANASYLGNYETENAYAREAADLIVQVCGPRHYGRVMFSTSGGAANDLMLKIVRHYHTLRDDRRRNGILAMKGCWHGLTYGAFALTSDELGQRMYGVDRRLVVHVNPNDSAELENLLASHGDRIGAIVVEPVLGTGAIPLTEDYLSCLARMRREHGFLLVADEVATGFGRTGSYFASHRWPEPPDILVTSKGLTNGTCAASAVVVSHAVAETFEDAGAVVGHGETQAGTAASCAAIIATIGEMHRLDAVARGVALADRLDRALASLVHDEPTVATVTGLGCFRAIGLLGEDGAPLARDRVPHVIEAVREAGALVHAAPDGIQLLPALIYSPDDVDELLAIVRAGLQAFSRGGTALAQD